MKPSPNSSAAIDRLADKLAAQDSLKLPADQAQTMLGRIRSQFAHRGFVSVSEVAAACNLSGRTVLAWREEGLIDGINVGARDKPYYRIFAPSVVLFFEKRSREP